MKKILLSAALFVAFAGVATGSSINGDYKGNPIVKVNVNGGMIDSEVPAQIIDGSTLLPLRAVSEALGATVSWDQSTYTVNVTSNPNQINKNVAQLGSITEGYRGVYYLTETIAKTSLYSLIMSDAIDLGKTDELKSDINGITYDYLDTWLDYLIRNNYSQELINNYKSAIESLKKCKTYLQNLDNGNANAEIKNATISKNKVMDLLESSYDVYLNNR